MSWLRSHLEDFVFLHIEKQTITPLGYFSIEEMTAIKNTWRSFKKHARGKTILLPGRDVFVFEILARRENYPTLFMPEISRKTVSFYNGKIPHDVCILDTGFAGSIPRGLGIQSFKMMSHNKKRSDIHVFPRMRISRTLALKIENTPKYWSTAYITQGELHQVKSNKFEFTNAARLTVEIYTNSSPRFVQQLPKGGHSWNTISHYWMIY